MQAESERDIGLLTIFELKLFHGIWPMINFYISA